MAKPIFLRLCILCSERDRFVFIRNLFAASGISEQQKAFYLAELDEYLANN